MATFLTTEKMSPALRARVEASVNGRRGSSGSRLSPRAVMFLRAAAVAIAFACLVSLGLSERRSNDALESERAALLGRWARASAGLTSRDSALMARVEPWLSRSSGEYQGDLVEPTLRDESALSGVLGRPTVFLRAPLERVGSRKEVEQAALDSAIDAFVYCLLDPPIERSEKWLIRRVRSAYSGDGRMREATSHVARLGAAVVGLPFLDPAWARRVREAEGEQQLATLRRSFERAPVQAARDAAKAASLLLVVDEPGSRAVPAELDGERPHDARVLLVDLEKDRLLLRIRRRVDPSWLSDGGRAEYASGVDSCSLAMDVRAALVAGRASPSAAPAPDSRIR